MISYLGCLGHMNEGGHMRLNWIENKFICKELYAPFVVEKDCEYRHDLFLKIRYCNRAGKDCRGR